MALLTLAGVIYYLISGPLILILISFIGLFGICVPRAFKGIEFMRRTTPDGALHGLFITRVITLVVQLIVDTSIITCKTFVRELANFYF